LLLFGSFYEAECAENGSTKRKWAFVSWFKVYNYQVVKKSLHRTCIMYCNVALYIQYKLKSFPEKWTYLTWLYLQLWIYYLLLCSHPCWHETILVPVVPPPVFTPSPCVRYSLNGGIKTVPVPYLPADTTRSVSSTSEYGASGGGVGGGGVASRPTSRHSHRPRGPPSTSGSNSGR
jgi:hypothetical protein